MAQRRRCRWFGLKGFASVGVGILMAGSLAAAEPRWIPLGPPAGPLASRLVLDPQSGSRGYALTAAGLWRTQNGGSTWRAVQNGLDWPPRAVAVDPAHPGRLYAAVTDVSDAGSIRRSDDFGDHWQTLFRDPYGDSYYFQDLQVDPFAPGTLYWTHHQDLYRSRDGGRTWSCVPLPSGGCGEVSAFALSPDRPRTLYVAAGASFYQSVNGGRTWSSSTLFENEYPPDVIVATRGSRTVYAWSAGSGYRGNLTPCFVRSDDDGATWKALLPQTQCGAPVIDPDDPRTVRIVVGTAGGAQLQVSHDGGEHWTSSGAVPQVGDLYLTADRRLVLSSEVGLFQAPGEAGPWQPSNRGFAASEITAILPTEHSLLAAPVRETFSLTPPAVPLVSTGDGGRSWNGLPVTNPVALAADPSDPQHLIASALRYETYEQHPRVLESRDEGATWRGVVDPQVDPPVFLTLAVDPQEPRTFYGGTEYGGFYRSTDGGRTWQASNSGLRLNGCHHYYCSTNWVHAIFTDPQTPGHLFMHFETQVYESVDHGSHWALRGPQLPRFGRVFALARDPQGALVAIGSGARPSDANVLGVVYRSADGGVTWTRTGWLPDQPGNGRVTELTGLVAIRSGLFLGTTTLGVLRSTDGGNLWKPVNEGLPFSAVTALVADPFDPSRLYATVPRNGIYTLRIPAP